MVIFQAIIPGLALAKEKKIKAGFIYVGPVGDNGYTYGHDEGRLFAGLTLEWIFYTLLSMGERHNPIQVKPGLNQKGDYHGSND